MDGRLGIGPVGDGSGGGEFEFEEAWFLKGKDHVEGDGLHLLRGEEEGV